MGEDYVVLKAVHPTWCTTQLPGDVAELLGISSDVLKGLHRPARALAFLSRGPGTLRVLSLYRGGDLLAKEMAADRVVATAQLTEKHVFNIPGAVEEHLGLVSRPQETRNTRWTNDMIVWFLPKDEYYEYRQVVAGGSEFPGLRSRTPPRVYLTKSLFGDLRPNLLEEEGLRGTPLSRSPLPKARR